MATSSPFEDATANAKQKIQKNPVSTFVITLAIAILALGIAVWALVAFYVEKGNEDDQSTSTKSGRKNTSVESKEPVGVNAQTAPFPVTRVSFSSGDTLGPYQTESGFHYIVSLNFNQNTLKLPPIPTSSFLNGEYSNVDTNIVYNYPFVRLTIEPPVGINTTGSLNILTNFPNSASGFTTPRLVDILTPPSNGRPMTYDYAYQRWNKRWHRIDSEGAFLDGSLVD
jgi:hypothetical protein